jgi:hypothetical protein
VKLKSNLFKKAIQSLLLGASIFYIGRAFIRLDIKTFQFSDPILAAEVSIACIITYAVFFSLLAIGWKLILDRIAYPRNIAFNEIYILYTKTNLMKYLPGNVMEWVGRNILGTRYGLTHSQIALSSVVETLIILAISGLLSCIVIIEGAWIVVKNFDFSYFYILITLLTLAGILCFRYSSQFIKTLNQLLPDYKQIVSREFAKTVIQVALLQLFVFLNLGIAFVAIIYFIFGFHVDGYSAIKIISAFSFSWVLGFVTPGAPGGVGIKEALLLFTLSPICGEQVVVLAGVLHRLISIAGDGLAFGLAQIYHFHKGNTYCK